jgi:hypothetical protein
MERQTRRVVRHCSTVVVEQAEFKVSKKGRERVLREKSKNVHAFVCGTVCEDRPIPELDTLVAVTYNPYKYATFVRRDTEEPVHNADLVVMIDGKCWAQLGA